MRVPPTIKSVPDQSMVLRPAIRGVFGESTSRKKNKTRKENPPIGTGEVSSNCSCSGQDIEHTVEIETPTPGDTGRKGASNKWAQRACDGPSRSKKCIVHRSFSADSQQHEPE